MTKNNKRTPEEALRASVSALDGLQAVGSGLRSDIDPVLAGQWLAHCLTATKRDKLALTQIVKIFRDACALGEHDGFAMFAAICGYDSAPSCVESELRRAREDAARLLRDAQEAARDYAELADRPDLLARARSVHLKVDA